MEAIRKSFKSHNSNKHFRKISAGGGYDLSYEQQQPILLNHDGVECGSDNMGAVPIEDGREVIVKIDGSVGYGSDGNRGGKIWRGSSYEFWKDVEGGVHNVGMNSNTGGGINERGSEGFDFPNSVSLGMEDPPSKLIGQFLQKQISSGAEMCLDMDLEMDELSGPHIRKLSTVAEENPSNRTVKFSDSIPSEIVEEGIRKRSSDQSDVDDDYSDHRKKSTNNMEEVLTCTSNYSFQKKSSLLRTKTRSRLLDPVEPPDRRSGKIPKSTQLRSGFLGKSAEVNGDDEEDPFNDEDLPDDYKKGNFSLLTLIQWVGLFLIIAALICSFSVPWFHGKTLWDLPPWKWEVMGLVLICGRLVSGWVVRMAVFFIQRNFLFRKRILYFVYGIRKPFQNCLWLTLGLVSWNYLFNKRAEKASKVLFYVTKVLVCLLVGTFVWLGKTLMVKVLASSFHVSTYFDRIQESLFNQYVVETLSGPPLVEMQRAQEEEERTMDEIHRLQNAGATVTPELKAAVFPARSGKLLRNVSMQKSPLGGRSIKLSGPVSKKLNDNKITIEHLHKLNNKNVSAWNMKRLINIVRHGALSTLDEQISDTNGFDESATQIRSEIEAKAAARKIYKNVSKPGKKFITLLDILRFMQPDEALKTMSLFEGANETKKISKLALKNWVVNAFRERRALSLTLNDTKTAVRKLHNMLNVVVAIILLIVWILILEIASTKFFVFLSSQLLLVAFIFGNTLKTIFESIIFLFVMHPFDVGDRCEIDEVQMVVEEMNILNTVFLRYDNLKIIYPNSVLSMKPISNFYRSPDMGDAVDFCIHIATPADKVTLMKQKIISYIENKKEHWDASPMIVLKDVEELNRLKMAVWLSHKFNHQDMGERWLRRAQLVEEMVRIFKELDIQYRMFPLDVNVRSLPTSARIPSEWTAPASAAN